MWHRKRRLASGLSAYIFRLLSNSLSMKLSSGAILSDVRWAMILIVVVSRRCATHLCTFWGSGNKPDWSGFQKSLLRRLLNQLLTPFLTAISNTSAVTTLAPCRTVLPGLVRYGAALNAAISVALRQSAMPLSEGEYQCNQGLYIIRRLSLVSRVRVRLELTHAAPS